MTNEIKHSIELTYIDILDLRLACTLAKQLSTESEKWDSLRDKLNKSLDEFYNS